MEQAGSSLTQWETAMDHAKFHASKGNMKVVRNYSGSPTMEPALTGEKYYIPPTNAS
jgi:hypothetical protein